MLRIPGPEEATITPAKLRYFMAAVDCGSLSAAAKELDVRQPTLSQQIAALESHLQQTPAAAHSGRGYGDGGGSDVVPARPHAGRPDRAWPRPRSARSGMPGRAGCRWAWRPVAPPRPWRLPLLRRLRTEHPGILLRLNDNFAGTLSEFIMTGRIDLALAYTAPPMQGLACRDLFIEELFVIAPPSVAIGRGQDRPVPLSSLGEVPMVLLSSVHFLRNVVDQACARAGFEPRVVAEIDSLAALLAAVASGLGVTILPRAAIGPASPTLVIHRLGPEPMEATVSLCTSAQLPVTAAIAQVGRLVEALVAERLDAATWPGVRRFAA